MKGTTEYNRISEHYVVLNLDPVQEEMRQANTRESERLLQERNRLSEEALRLAEERKRLEKERQCIAEERTRLEKERQCIAEETERERLAKETDRLEKEKQCIAEEKERERIAQELADQERIVQELADQERIEKYKIRQAERRIAERLERRNRNECASEKMLKDQENAEKEWYAKISEKNNFRENAKMEEKRNKIGEISDESLRVYEERMNEFDVEIVAIKALYDKATNDYAVDYKTYQEEKKINPHAIPPKEILSWDIPLEKWEKRKQNFVEHHTIAYRRKINAIKEEYKDVVLTESRDVRLPHRWEIRADNRGVYYFDPRTEVRIEESEKHKLHYYR